MAYLSKLVRQMLRSLLGLLIAAFCVVICYLLVAMAGAYIPRDTLQRTEPGIEENEVIVLLLSTWLHADFALPVDDYVLDKLSFMQSAGIPLDNPDLRYIAIGWGARSFYPIATGYNNATIIAALTAITGDRSVLHTVGFGELARTDDVYKISMTRKQFHRLVDFIVASFERNDQGEPQWLKGLSHGYNDVFHKAWAPFNILEPCNIWVADALHYADVRVGAWTPTTQSLRLSLKYFAH